MELRDPKKLQRLMIVQDVSQRELAIAAGWKSHSYLGRLLRGEVKTLETTPALRIAHYLQVGTEDLFLTKVSTEIDHSSTRTERGVSRSCSSNRRKVAS